MTPRFSAEFVAFLGATFLPADAQRVPMPWTVAQTRTPPVGASWLGDRMSYGISGFSRAFGGLIRFY